MAIEFECPECDATIRVKESAAGKTGRCPKCRELLLIPDPAEWEDEDWEDEDEERESKEAAEADAESQANASEAKPASLPPEPLVSRASATLPFPALTAGQEASSVAPEERPASAAEREQRESATVGLTPVGKPTLAPQEGSEGDTVVLPGWEGQHGAEETVNHRAAPTEILTTASSPPESVSSPFPSDDPTSIALSRAHSRRRRRRQIPLRKKLSIASAVGGIFVVVGGAWLLYFLTGPDLSGALKGQRLHQVSFDKVASPLPHGVPEEDVKKVMIALEGGGFALNSKYVLVTIGGDNEGLKISIAPGPDAVAVRVLLAKDPDIQAVLQEVGEKIVEDQGEQLANATARLFVEYAARLEKGSRIENRLELRNELALNAAVDPVGYAIEAVVRGTPLPCVYQDIEGYCYFFIPKGIDHVLIRGRQIFGPGTDAPLPVDFEVTLIDSDESIHASTEVAQREQGDEAIKASSDQKKSSADQKDSSEKMAGERDKSEAAESEPESSSAMGDKEEK